MVTHKSYGICQFSGLGLWVTMASPLLHLPGFPVSQSRPRSGFLTPCYLISSPSSTLTETAPNVPPNPTLSTAPPEARPASLSPAPLDHLLPALAAALPLPPDCHSLAESSPQSALLITAALCLKPLMAAFMCSTKASLGSPAADPSPHQGP